MSDKLADPVESSEQSVPAIRVHGIDRPWLWVERGWQDVRAIPRLSLLYGLIVAIVSWCLTGILFYSDQFYLLLPMLAGFALIAPFLAGGLYELSRRRLAGLPLSLRGALAGLRRNSGQIGLMGMVLLLLHLAWVRIATLLFTIFFSGGNTHPDAMIAALTTTDAGLLFLVIGTASGGILAIVVFAISAVSIPMLIDRDVNVILAIKTSVAAVLANWPAMLLWAAIIGFFTLVGLVTFYLGLILLLPLVGHATWHAYRDLVADERGDFQS